MSHQQKGNVELQEVNGRGVAIAWEPIDNHHHHLHQTPDHLLQNTKRPAAEVPYNRRNDDMSPSVQEVHLADERIEMDAGDQSHGQTWGLQDEESESSSDYWASRVKLMKDVFCADKGDDSECDPYVKVALKILEEDWDEHEFTRRKKELGEDRDNMPPQHKYNGPVIRQTRTVLAGGRNVMFERRRDVLEFPLDPALVDKYTLEILVMDEDIGVDDVIGLCNVQGISKKGQQTASLEQEYSLATDGDSGEEVTEFKLYCGSVLYETVITKDANGNPILRLWIAELKNLRTLSSDDGSPDDSSCIIQLKYVCMLGLYLTFIAWLFSEYLEEEWLFGDAMWFAIVQTSTVGYGDLHPTNETSRLVNIFFIFFGTLAVGRTVNSLFRIIMITGTPVMSAPLAIFAGAGAGGGGEGGTLSVKRRDTALLSGGANPFERCFSCCMANTERRGPVRGSPRRSMNRGPRAPASGTSQQSPSQDNVSKASGCCPRKPACCDCSDPIIAPGRAISIIGTFFFLVIGGTLFLWLYESKYDPEYENFVLCLHYVFVTLTTVGFGDITPSTSTGKLVNAILILLGVAIIGELAQLFMEYTTIRNEKKRQERFRKIIMQQSFDTVEEFLMYDREGKGEITKIDFFKQMLMIMNAVDPNVMQLIEKRWQEVDADGSGGLTAEDFVIRAPKDQEHAKPPKGFGFIGWRKEDDYLFKFSQQNLMEEAEADQTNAGNDHNHSTIRDSTGSNGPSSGNTTAVGAGFENSTSPHDE